MVGTASISEDLKKRAGKNMSFVTEIDKIKELASNLVPSGFGQSMLAKGDRVQAIKGLVLVKSTIKGQPEPIEYLAFVVEVQGAVEKLCAVSSLLRRKPGATANHGIFAEENFAKAVTIENVYDALVANPVFTVTDVLRNMEFPSFKASVYETSR
jgi:hypothetical protein